MRLTDKPPRSRVRRWAFRLVAVALPIVVLALVNFVLYCWGVGSDTTLVIRATKSRNDLYCFNPVADFPYYGKFGLDGPQPRYFSLPKPQDTHRIVVLGGSTVQGYPYASELAFPRQMEYLLSRQVPDRKFEVLNAGIVAINSFALVDVFRQSLAAEPDLVVLYAGHNEFYGPGGVGSRAVTLSSSFYSTMTRLRRFRLVQTMLKLTGGASNESTPLLNVLPGNLSIALDGPAFRAAERYYRRNLSKIAAAAQRAGVPIVFCSVACNLRDQSPMHSISSADVSTTEAKQRDEKLSLAREFLENGKTDAAFRLAEEAHAIDPGFALVEYRRAQCYVAAGRGDPAVAAYSLARDLDGCRFRAPSSFREIVRDVAQGRSGSDIYLVDFAGAMTTHSTNGLPGNDLFLEHVHFNFAGHQLAAGMIAQAITEEVLHRDWDPARVPSQIDLEQWLGITVQDHLCVFGLVGSALKGLPPLNLAPDRDQQIGFINRASAMAIGQLSGDRRKMMSELDMEELQLDLCNVIGKVLLENNEPEQALEMFQLGQRRRPWDAQSYFGAAECLKRLGRDSDALNTMMKGLEVVPDIADVVEAYPELTDEFIEGPRSR